MQQQHNQQRSTYWLWFEVLWREYFYCIALRHGPELFRAVDGVAGQAAVCALFMANRCSGLVAKNTSFPLVNAAMNSCGRPV